ncbi:MAG: 50S ribosomal protein L6 [Gammaproteobacteria bacterium]
MSRFIKKAIPVPDGVSVDLGAGGDITAKGPAGEVRRRLFDERVEIKREGEALRVSCRTPDAGAVAGTFWCILRNMVEGAHRGFEVALLLQGVGYRAQLSGGVVNLQLGFSHPVHYKLPEGVSAQAPSQTELILKSADKMLAGQTAAEIRGMRPPEPYKGKGIRYRGEQITLKETKKK